MKKIIPSVGLLVLLGLLFLGAQEKKFPLDKNFYENSLHFTSRGLEFWYSKEQGGLERITGIPFKDLPCANCHVRSCDACHRQEVGGKLHYSLETARSQEACLNCHGIESYDHALKNPGDPGTDVHFKRGMKCLDCHSLREVHGDGTAYTSMQQPGAMDTTCRKCHIDLSACAGHGVHGDKVDCNACHVRDLPACYNCHFDSRVKEGKSLSLPLQDVLFLVNHEGKVTLGNFHTFVYRNKTMITFAPAFPHAVMKEGRGCPDCHATPVLKAMRTSDFAPVTFQKGTLSNVKGVVPVVEGQDWRFVFLNYENGQWIPIKDPAAPLINYAGYCSPLTKEQFAKLEKAVGRASK